MLYELVILGAGESGVGAAILAKAKGFNVFVSDNGTISKPYKEDLIINSIAFEEGRHTEDLILNAIQVIKSPGIPDDSPIIRKLLRDRIHVISEIEFASYFTNARFIAVTGSNGKTTTTLLIHYLCKQAGLNVCLAGNVGNSLCRQVYYEEVSHHPLSINHQPSYYIVELSSFQLDGIRRFSPHIAVLLNITPDHLDRYDNHFDNYIDSKFRIIRRMVTNDYFIYWEKDDIIAKEISERKIKPFKLPVSLNKEVLKGSYISDNNIIVNIGRYFLKFPPFHLPSSILPLQGKHNTINTMAAILAATLAGVDKSTIIRSLKGFKNAPHRLELVGTINGIKFINDSKATNVDAVWYALDSLPSLSRAKGRGQSQDLVEKIIWLAGGLDKGNNYGRINDLVKDKVKAIVCLGIDNSKIHAAFNGHVKQLVDTKNMEEAVKKAFKFAKSGDVILLSPACASFDLFKNYKDRGEQFKKQFKVLKIENSK